MLTHKKPTRRRAVKCWDVLIGLVMVAVVLLNACSHDAAAQAEAWHGGHAQPLITFRSIALVDADASDFEAVPAASKPKLQWKVEVDPQKGGSLGWKTTVYVAGFFVLKVPGARNVLCYSKIGVPMKNYLGPVSDAFAEEAILVAGQAVGVQMQEELRAGDPEELLPAESICIAFRRRLIAALKPVIPGVRVENLPAPP